MSWCPKCNYPQCCPCVSCKDKLPKGFKPWKWQPNGEVIECGKCGHSLHADQWLDIEYKQFKQTETQNEEG